MENWRPVAGWSIGAVLLIVVFAAGQALLNSLDIRLDSLALAKLVRLKENWLETGYDWSGLPHLCLVAGESIFAAWFLGKGTQILPRDTHPILPCAGAGLILTAAVLSSCIWIGGHLPH